MCLETKPQMVPMHLSIGETRVWRQGQIYNPARIISNHPQKSHRFVQIQGLQVPLDIWKW